MLSPDSSKHRAGEMRRPRRRGRGAGPGTSTAAAGGMPFGPGQCFDTNNPWDIRSAEALTRLYESEEGSLSRPAPRQRARHVPAQAKGAAKAEHPSETADRTWLEAHLSRLAKRLQDSLDRPDTKQPFAALNGRLDDLEQRFGTALGRVAQRSDLDSLKSIEANVMELAAQLNRARDRLELIGGIDEEVRGVARKLDQSGERRADAFEKLLRDCVAEWRESEQRTASALHSLEEEVYRLGDTVDAMEASKPAPELTVPTLAPELERSTAAMDSLSRLDTANVRPLTTHFYHPTLDAADYAPRSAELRPPEATESVARARLSAPPPAAVEWSAPPAQAELGTAEASSTRAGWHVMAMREKLRQAPMGFQATRPEPPDAEAPAPDTFKRASLNFLLMAGAAVLAGTYFLYRTVAAPLAPVGPAMSGSDAHPDDGAELADPGPRLRGEGAS